MSVGFAPSDAARIAETVKRVERMPYNQPRGRRHNVTPGLPAALFLGKTNAAIAKDASGEVSRYRGGDSETDTDTDDTVKNLFNDVEADVWVIYVKIDGTFYLISSDSVNVAIATASLSAAMCGSTGTIDTGSFLLTSQGDGPEPTATVQNPRGHQGMSGDEVVLVYHHGRAVPAWEVWDVTKHVESFVTNVTFSGGCVSQAKKSAAIEKCGDGETSSQVFCFSEFVCPTP